MALTEETVRIGDGGGVGEDTWTQVRAAFNDAEIAALLYTVALIRFWNTLNVAVEFPAHADLPTMS